MDIDLSILSRLFLYENDIDIVPLIVTYTDESTETINVIIRNSASTIQSLDDVEEDMNS
jgi:hypothetical protein